MTGVCRDAVDGFECICPEGREGDKCERDIDYCEPNPCLNDGNCTSDAKNYSCICRKGFTGRNCETGMTLMAFFEKNTDLKII